MSIGAKRGYKSTSGQILIFVQWGMLWFSILVCYNLDLYYLIKYQLMFTLRSPVDFESLVAFFYTTVSFNSHITFYSLLILVRYNSYQW